MIPRAEELVSDEDSEEEEDTEGVGMNINHLGEGMLRQQCELVMIGCVDDAEEPDIQVINDAGEVIAEQQEIDPVPGSSGNKRRRTSGLPAAVAAKEVPFTQLGRLKNKERMWSRNTPAQFSENIPPFQQSGPLQICQ